MRCLYDRNKMTLTAESDPPGFDALSRLYLDRPLFFGLINLQLFALSGGDCHKYIYDRLHYSTIVYAVDRSFDKAARIIR